MKAMTRRAMGNRGFTLIELMLVLVILAVLATIVMRNFAGQSEKARVTTAKAQITNIAGALDSFEVDCGRYPTSEEGLASLLEQPGNSKGWAGPYLKQKIGNDPWGHPYIYKNPGQHNAKHFDVYSAGPDGTEGTEDDVGNWNDESK